VTKTEQQDTDSREGAQRRHCPARRPWREDQFEQRHGIARARLKRPEWTIPMIGRDECPLGGERGNR
jgi:hypothetical protein